MQAELLAFKKETEVPKEEYVQKGTTLMDRYIEPPFSVIDAKSGRWQARKNQWKELGIKSEVGRDVVVLPGASNNDYMPDMGTSTSVFDPALCELMYKWFCDEGGLILDPFAGGSVRGIVAQKLGYEYTGIELREEQVVSNRDQAIEILEPSNHPTWICGDSDQVLDTITDEFDMIFSCPPYFDLEVYSQDENDLSNMTYEAFIKKYTSIIHKSLSKLKYRGYAVFVIGDVRDERGNYRDFIGDTKRAFMDLYFKNDGAKLYNDIIFLDPIGTAMIRAENTWSSKKVVKVHQNILVFKKE